MEWIFVLLAVAFENISVMGLKRYSQVKTFRNGLTYLDRFDILYASFRYLQVSVAYACWIGIGTAGAVLSNIFLAVLSNI